MRASQIKRRQFLQNSFKLSLSALGVGSGVAVAQDGIFEKLLSGVDQTQGTLLDRIDVVLRNAQKAFRGMYHGYGLGIHKILADTAGPLPTSPERSHAGWPHIHCVCHCNTVANLGEDEGSEISRIGGIADEVNQTFFAKLFYSTILPMVWNDQVAKYSGPNRFTSAQRDMDYLMSYAFGSDRARQRSLVLAAAADKRNRERLLAFRDLIYGLVDALESAWQRSDFFDNEIGRQGGCRCPKGLSIAKKREWCVTWCTQKGVPPDVAEGYRTDRPWGPFHPLHPGPIPTVHDALHGQQKEIVDRSLLVPLPEFEPIAVPQLAGMARMKGPLSFSDR